MESGHRIDEIIEDIALKHSGQMKFEGYEPF